MQIAARSHCASSTPARRWASAPSPSTARPTATPSTSVSPTKPSASARPRSADSYLNVPAVISAAEIADVDAIHPGYGLLSENANFAEVCRASNIKFIGPPPEVTRMMGEKSTARQTMKKAKVPILPGSDGVIAYEDEALEWAKAVGYPVILKAVAGGGGRGMRIVRTPDELPGLFQQASSEAAGAFGNGDLYMEKFIERPRHIEFQVLADEHGNVHVARRARVLHPAPPPEAHRRSAQPAVTPKLRAELGQVIQQVASKTSATGTPAPSSSSWTRTARSTSSR